MIRAEIARARIPGDGLAGLGLDALREAAPKCPSHKQLDCLFD